MRSMVAIFITLGISTPLYAGDAEAGKKRATVCAGCHGNDGMAFIPNYPNLAGQNELYLVESLKAYRDGLRRHMQMTPMAKGLSDTEIENLAAYFSSLPPKVKGTQ
nr:cytochrome c [Alteromonas facilis]